MKKLEITFFLMCAIATSSLLGQTNVFSKLYDAVDTTISYAQGHSICHAFDNGYMVVGGNTQGNQNKGLICKIDSAGNYLWGKDLSSFADSMTTDVTALYSIKPTHDSNFIAVGTIFDSVTLHTSAFCVKLNTSGDTIWSNAISLAGYDQARHVEETFDHGYIICGVNTDSIEKIIAIKLDSLGNLQWRKTIAIGDWINAANCIKQTPDSGYVICGSFWSLGPQIFNAVLIKLDQSGSVSWSKKYNITSPSFNTGGLDLVVMPDGYLFYANAYGATVIKTDFFGSIQWSKGYNIGCDIGEGISTSTILPLSSGSIIILSSSGFARSGLAKIDSIGNLIWARQLIINSSQVIEAEDGGLLVLGNGPSTFVVIKTDSLGNGVDCIEQDMFATSFVDTIISSTTPFTETAGGMISTVRPHFFTPSFIVTDGCAPFTLDISKENLATAFTIFPNPFTDQTTVAFTGVTTNASIQIIDILGKTIYRSQIPENSTTFIIEKGNINSGIYFVQIQSNTGTISKKIIIQ